MISGNSRTISKCGPSGPRVFGGIDVKFPGLGGGSETQQNLYDAVTVSKWAGDIARGKSGGPLLGRRQREHAGGGTDGLRQGFGSGGEPVGEGGQWVGSRQGWRRGTRWLTTKIRQGRRDYHRGGVRHENARGRRFGIHSQGRPAGDNSRRHAEPVQEPDTHWKTSARGSAGWIRRIWSDCGRSTPSGGGSSGRNRSWRSATRFSNSATTFRITSWHAPAAIPNFHRPFSAHGIPPTNRVWEGDYHLNYNHMAPFYGLYSSNHIEQADPYHAPDSRFQATRPVVCKERTEHPRCLLPGRDRAEGD